MRLQSRKCKPHCYHALRLEWSGPTATAVPAKLLPVVAPQYFAHRCASYDRTPAHVVVGLGYVGLPLAVALATKFETTGFDVNSSRIAELGAGIDHTREVAEEAPAFDQPAYDRELRRLCGRRRLSLPFDPVDEAHQPDLTAVMAATRMVAGLIDPARRPTIVYSKAPSIPASLMIFAGRRRAASGAGLRPRFLPWLFPGTHQSRRPRAYDRQDHQGDRRPGC